MSGSYSKRVRTPKKFFDEISEESPTQKRKLKGESKTEKTKTPTRGKKKGGQKHTADGDASQLSTESKDSENVTVEQTQVKGETDAVSVGSTPGVDPTETASVSQTSLDDGVIDWANTEDKIKGETEDKSQKAGPSRSKKRKGQPQKSLPSLDKSPERIVADISQVRAVKEMVESIRQTRSRNNSPVPKEFNIEDGPSKVGDKVVNNCSIPFKKKVTDKRTNNELVKVSEKLIKESSGETEKVNTDASDQCQVTGANIEKKGNKTLNKSSINDTDSNKVDLGNTCEESHVESKIEETSTDNANTDSGAEKSIENDNLTDSISKGRNASASSIKRGKRKKTEDESESNTEVDNLSNASPTTTSRFGRKRKALDYSDMFKDKENSDNDSKETSNEKQNNKSRKSDKKSQVTADTPDHSTQKEITLENDTTSVSKSGRKKRKVDYSRYDKDENVDTIDSDDQDAQLKKKVKRGRKPKKSLEEEDDDNDGEDTIDSDDQDVQPKKKGKRGRKPGRKPKKSVEEDNDDDENTVDSDNQEVQPKKKGKRSRKPGRKPKKSVEEDDDEGGIRFSCFNPLLAMLFL